MWHFGKGKIMEMVESSVIANVGLEEGEGWKGKHRGLSGQWKSLHETIMMDVCHYIFVQIHKMYMKSEQ